MSLDFDGFSALVDEILHRNPGVDEELAAKYAALLGDIREIDEDGKVVVRDEGRVVARIRINE